MHLIFDLDGTIIDSRPGIVDSLSHATKLFLGNEHNFTLSHIGPPINVMIENTFPDISKSKVSEVVGGFREHYDSVGWKGFTLYPGVYGTLSALSKNHSMSIATNKPSKPTNKILLESGVAHFFENILCYGMGNYKNKSEMVFELSDINEDISIMIGDSTDDCLAAQNNKIRFIHCAYGYGEIEPNNMANNEKIFNFSEILEVV